MCEKDLKDADDCINLIDAVREKFNSLMELMLIASHADTRQIMIENESLGGLSWLLSDLVTPAFEAAKKLADFCPERRVQR